MAISQPIHNKTASNIVLAIVGPTVVKSTFVMLSGICANVGLTFFKSATIANTPKRLRQHPTKLPQKKANQPMKTKLLINLFAFTTSIFLGCKRDDCFTPPDSIVFEFVDTSGENLIQNGTLDKSKISVQQTEWGGDAVVIMPNLRLDNRISFDEIAWSSGTKNYDVQLDLDSLKTFNFTLTSSEITGNCSGFRIDDFQIENINSIEENGYYKIIVE